MPLGVFTDVKKKTNHGRGQLLASHTARLAEGNRVKRAHDCFCVIECGVDKRQQFFAPGAVSFVLRLEESQLAGVQRFSL